MYIYTYINTIYPLYSRIIGKGVCSHEGYLAFAGMSREELELELTANLDETTDIVRYCKFVDLQQVELEHGGVGWEHLAVPGTGGRAFGGCAGECGRYVHPDPKYAAFCCGACCYNFYLGHSKSLRQQRHGDRCFAALHGPYAAIADPFCRYPPPACLSQPRGRISVSTGLCVLTSPGADASFAPWCRRIGTRHIS